MNMKKTMVIGASTNPERYAYKAIKKLVENNHPVVAIGLKEGQVDLVEIQKGFPDVKDLDTVTLYLSSLNQKPYYDYILRQHPKRIIFNPGAENSELKALATKNGIETVEGCTLVMLSIKNY
jgi:predicted CoA-binding protein